MLKDELFALLKEKFERDKITVSYFCYDAYLEIRGPITKIKIDKIGGKKGHYLDYYNEEVKHNAARYFTISHEADLSTIIQTLLSVGIEVEVLTED